MPILQPQSTSPIIAKNSSEMRSIIRQWQRQGLRIGLVPTMGALHIGHASLMKRAKQECDRVIVSIFVNPTQFNRADDLAKYPRTLDADIAVCEQNQVDLVFCPDVAEIYPHGFQSNISLKTVTQHWEGPSRPGHFDGVATIVAKLFNLTTPTHAYFGEKDYQQLQLIQSMVRDLDFPLQVIGCATVREQSGLAFSSRNALLDPALRPIAPVLYKTMQDMAQTILSGTDPITAGKNATKILLDSGFSQVDYIAAADAKTLQPLHTVPTQPSRILAAAWLGSVRLIDNISLSS